MSDQEIINQFLILNGARMMFSYNDVLYFMATARRDQLRIDYESVQKIMNDVFHPESK